MALFKKSLRFRITFLVVLLVLALFVANAIVSTRQAKENFESLLDEKYVATAEYLSEVVEEWFAENTGVLNAMDSLSAISEENAASSEETSATTTEINRTVETLSDASRDLNQVAHDLNECLSIFK